MLPAEWERTDDPVVQIRTSLPLSPEYCGCCLLLLGAFQPARKSVQLTNGTQDTAYHACVHDAPVQYNTTTKSTTYLHLPNGCEFLKGELAAQKLNQYFESVTVLRLMKVTWRGEQGNRGPFYIPCWYNKQYKKKVKMMLARVESVPSTVSHFLGSQTLTFKGNRQNPIFKEPLGYDVLWYARLGRPLLWVVYQLGYLWCVQVNSFLSILQIGYFHIIMKIKQWYYC